jgi:putative serine protease PepD
VSRDDSEPTVRMPRDPEDPDRGVSEPTRVLADPLGSQPLVQPRGPQPLRQEPLRQQPSGTPGSDSLSRPPDPAWRPVYPGQAWPTSTGYQPPAYPAPQPSSFGPPPGGWHQQQSTAYTPPPVDRGGRIVAIAAAVALVVGLIAGVAAAMSVVALDDDPGAEPIDPSIGNGGGPRVRSGSVADVAATLLPSVVQLKVEGDDEQATGSGFVIDASGHILTNNHVVSAAADGGTIQVVTDKGDTAAARLVGRSPAYDLAVVQVDGLSARPVRFGRSSQVVVGQDVVAIGSPLGLAGTVTSGIISAKNRPVTAGGEGEISYINALQTDAAINPGNSGGPLVDMSGQVVGVNSAIATVRGQSSEQGGNIGLGFAIPIDQARRTAQQLISTGKASYPVIGANVDMQFEGGARVSQINPGSPAQRAGLREGDVVTEIDGQTVTSAEALIVAIRTHRPGERVQLTYERDGRSRQATVTLGQQTG